MRCPAGSDDRARDRGQAVVELALCLPLVCLVTLAVVQVGLVVRDRMLVIAAAREGARAAAVAGAPDAAARAAVAARPGLALEVRTAAAGTRVTVTVSTTNRTDVPLVGLLLPDIELSASATMQLEPP